MFGFWAAFGGVDGRRFAADRGICVSRCDVACGVVEVNCVAASADRGILALNVLILQISKTAA